MTRGLDLMLARLRQGGANSRIEERFLSLLEDLPPAVQERYRERLHTLKAEGRPPEPLPKGEETVVAATATPAPDEETVVSPAAPVTAGDDTAVTVPPPPRDEETVIASVASSSVDEETVVATTVAEATVVDRPLPDPPAGEATVVDQPLPESEATVVDRPLPDPPAGEATVVDQPLPESEATVVDHPPPETANAAPVVDQPPPPEPAAGPTFALREGPPPAEPYRGHELEAPEVEEPVAIALRQHPQVAADDEPEAAPPAAAVLPRDRELSPSSPERSAPQPEPEQASASTPRLHDLAAETLGDEAQLMVVEPSSRPRQAPPPLSAAIAEGLAQERDDQMTALIEGLDLAFDPDWWPLRGAEAPTPLSLWGRYLDGLLARERFREAWVVIRRDFPQDAGADWCDAVNRRLPLLWEGLRVRGWRWDPSSGARGLRELLARPLQPGGGGIVI